MQKGKNMISSNTHRLTNGHIASTLLKFALPYLASNFLMAFYGAADVFIVSYFADPSVLAATATGAQAIFMMMALAIGLGLGGTILIGQYFGAKQETDVLETIKTLLTLFMGTAIICASFMLIFAQEIAELLKTPPESLNKAAQYIAICGGGLVFTFAFEAISAILRALGDSQNPMKFIAIACSLNIVLDLLFIGYFKWEAAGAAIATVMAQACSVIIAILYLKRQKFIFNFSIKNIDFYPQKAKKILHLGIPTAIQQSIIFGSFTFMVAIVNKMGVIAAAAVGITTKIDSFMIMPAMAFASAVSVMVAQNIGANQIQRAKETFYTGFLMSLCFGVPAFITMYTNAEWVMNLFTNNANIIQRGSEFIVAYSPDCILLCLVFCINGFMNGCGRTTFTMINNVSSTLFVRIPLIYIATSLFAVGLALPIATAPQITFALIYFYSGKWKKSIINNRRKLS